MIIFNETTVLAGWIMATVSSMNGLMHVPDVRRINVHTPSQYVNSADLQAYRLRAAVKLRVIHSWLDHRASLL